MIEPAVVLRRPAWPSTIEPTDICDANICAETEGDATDGLGQVHDPRPSGGQKRDNVRYRPFGLEFWPDTASCAGPASAKTDAGYAGGHPRAGGGPGRRAGDADACAI